MYQCSTCYPCRGPLRFCSSAWVSCTWPRNGKHTHTHTQVHMMMRALLTCATHRIVENVGRMSAREYNLGRMSPRESVEGIYQASVPWACAGLSPSLTTTSVVHPPPPLLRVTYMSAETLSRPKRYNQQDVLSCILFPLPLRACVPLPLPLRLGGFPAYAAYYTDSPTRPHTCTPQRYTLHPTPQAPTLRP
jgi:hypothetical protein